MTSPLEMTAVAEPIAPQGSVRGFLRLVAIEHSIFALPFAYIAALVEMGDHVDWQVLGLITLAMVSGRTVAMAANRVIDRELDARNPRTAQRELVTGTLSVRTAVIGAAVALAVFVVTAAALSPLCLALSPIALVVFVAYPYAKRFTWLCHFVLGLAQAIVPTGAAIAVADEWTVPVALAIAVGTWVAGFDLIYACQDVASDRREGVHSLPARFGVPRGLEVSGLLHVVTVAALLWYGDDAGLGPGWFIGVVLVAAALCYEHVIVKPDDLSRVNRAFFTVNGFVGLGLLVAYLVNRL